MISSTIEIEKERKASPKLTKEIVYEKKVAKYDGVSRFAHKLQQYYKFYLIASQVIFSAKASTSFRSLF